MDKKELGYQAPENCQQEPENTEHTLLKRPRTRNFKKKKDTRSVGCFFLSYFGNRLLFPVNEKEDISTIQ